MDYFSIMCSIVEINFLQNGVTVANCNYTFCCSLTAKGYSFRQKTKLMKVQKCK